MALSKIDAANFLTGTIPQGNVANASLGAVTALPAAIATGKVLQAAYAVNTTEVTSAGGVDITSISFTPTNSSNKIIFFGNVSQIRKANAGTSDAAGLIIQVAGVNTNASASNEGYPESESDTRGNMTCIGYGNAWSGAQTVSLRANGFGSGISYSYQSAPSTLIVLEVEA